MQVVRALNNNAVLAQEAGGRRVVVMGRGIGYGRRLGDPVDEAGVTQRYVPDVSHPIGALTALVDEMPLEVAQAAAAIVAMARERLGIAASQGLALLVADHLRYALVRLREGAITAYPLQWEVGQLYPDELAAGHTACEIAGAEVGTQVPSQEAVAFAMHFVNASFSTDDLGRTVRMTQRIQVILAVVRAALDIDADERSMSVARFVTHLRYLFVRVASGRQIDEAPELLGLAVAQNHPRAHRTARRIAELFDLDGTPITANETAYLALHVARLERDHEQRT